MGWGNSPHGNPGGTQGPSADAHGGFGGGLSGETGGANLSNDPNRSPHHNPRGLGFSTSLNDPFGYGIGLDGDIIGRGDVISNWDKKSYDPLEENDEDERTVQDIQDKTKSSLMKNFVKGFLGVMLAPATMGLSLGLTGTAIGNAAKTGITGFKGVNSLKDEAKDGNLHAQQALDDMADRTEDSRQNRAANENWDSPDRSVGGGTSRPVNMQWARGIGQQEVQQQEQARVGLAQDFDKYTSKGRDMLDRKKQDGESLREKAISHLLKGEDREELQNQLKKYIQLAIQNTQGVV